MILFSSRSSLVLSAVLITTLVTSLIVLGIDGDLISGAGRAADGPWAFNIFLPIWTWLSVIPLLVLPLLGSSALAALLQTRFVLANFGLLWVFWLAAAASTTDRVDNYLSGCGTYRSSYYNLGSECGKARGLLAFLWITWLLFTFLLGALLAFALRESTKGRKDVWSSSVFDYPWGRTAGAHPSSTAHPAEPNVEMANAPASTTAASAPAAAPPASVPAPAATTTTTAA